MTLRTSILILVTAMCCSSQEEKKSYLLPKKTLDSVQKHYGILDALAAARVPGQNAIADLTALDEWLEEQYKLGRRKNRDKSLRSFSREFVDILREDEDKRLCYEIQLTFALRSSSEEAGQAAAMYLFNVPIRFERASFSGIPIGDWTGSWYDDSYGANLIFIRRNVFVRVSYGGLYESLKQDPKSRRRLPDASLRQKCEAMARDIDAQIDRLPAKKM